MTVKKRVYTDINHHYKYGYKSQYAEFCFLPISKCASTSIKFHPSLGLDTNTLVNIESYQSNTYACIRDPISRFFSSIAETLQRYTTRHFCEPTWKSAVLVSQDIYDELQNLHKNIMQPKIFLEGYISLLKNGFFDAHHMPQKFFLTHQDNTLINDMHLFCQDSLELAVTEVCRQNFLQYTPGHRLNEANTFKNRKKSIKFLPRISFKKSLQRFGYYHIGTSQKVKNPYTQDGNSIIGFSNSLKHAAKGDSDIIKEITCLYEADMVLYKSLKSSEALISHYNKNTMI